jgi:hypothetical protein
MINKINKEGRRAMDIKNNKKTNKKYKRVIKTIKV